MTNPIPLGDTLWTRPDAEDVSIILQNRYFEVNPANVEEQSALLTRPGFKKWLTLSGSPIDNIFFQPGSFNNSFFAASGRALYKIDTNETVTTVASDIFNTSFGTLGRTTINMAATASIGSTPAYMWMVDGINLWLYADSSCARGTLTASGAISNGDRVNINGSFYQWTNGSVDAGSPAGTAGNPWLVKLGASAILSLATLRAAINLTGSTGVDYSTATTIHPTVYGFNSSTVATLTLYAKSFTSAGNSLTTAVVVGAAISFSGATLSGGGSVGVSQVVMPNDYGVIDLCFTAGYIVVAVGEGYGVNGRFYWINPGEVVVNALNFATAERSPDPLYNIEAVDDQFWLFGSNTTEIWYPSGDFNTPFQRLQGKLFTGGVWPGSVSKVREMVMLIDSDGVVYAVDNGPQRISTNAIEEMVRKSFVSQVTNGTVLRTWSFSMDGHDFYLIYLPGSFTLVYDLTTGKWSRWSSNSLAYLNQHVGINWLSVGSATYARGQNSNVIAGDLRSGQLWLVNPVLGYDENITTGAVEPFTSIVIGGVPLKGLNNLRCNMVFLRCAMAAPSVSGAAFTLRTSDDLGKSWVTHDVITMPTDTAEVALYWRSLGTMQAPGRIFEVSDNGASHRINSLDFT